jgi:hypothetical protein
MRTSVFSSNRLLITCFEDFLMNFSIILALVIHTKHFRIGIVVSIISWFMRHLDLIDNGFSVLNEFFTNNSFYTNPYRNKHKLDFWEKRMSEKNGHYLPSNFSPLPALITHPQPITTRKPFLHNKTPSFICQNILI